MMLAVIATAAGIARYSPFYRRELENSGKRELTLDGLRGLAALMVAAHHAALCCTWLAGGNWGEAGSTVLQLFAPVGVILFFMLTGYLFWSKARAQNGRINAIKLWRGRLYRIAPLYLFSLFIVLCVAVLQTGDHWLTWANWKPLLRLLALGALSWHNVGTVNLGEYNAGVVWTLWYEWAFYLALPFIAWLAVKRRIFIVAGLAYLLTFAGLWFGFNLQPGLFFILGMVCPALLENPRLRSLLARSILAGGAIFTTVLLCWLSRHYLLAKVPTVAVAGSLFPLFIVAAAGNNFFGLLTHPAIRCLGAMSFSLYLLHGIVFRWVFHILRAAGLADLSRLWCWLILVFTAIIITLLCSTTYRWIEFPFYPPAIRNLMAVKNRD
jgi:peptidoglycan/LPS O-acetylase OafA/YrhL